ncbi:FtsK/SpoIIIE domain-containing protein [Micromonospora sp. NPDC048842]|uniref:FtsK/SpoIIIE domain-containing protein n=1 Tax=Micromonospora sp. NPDC048842 TaxID=3154346 RepID=UPI0033F3FCAA
MTSDPITNPTDPPPDDKAARIVDLAQRRADRAAAAQGLSAADATDAETVTPDPVVVGGPVDPPERRPDLAEVLDRRSGPVLPLWLTDSYQRRDMLRRAASAAGYHVGTHVVLSPVYAGKVAWYAPKGAARLFSRVLGWTSAETGNWHLRQDAANRNDPKTWLDLDRHRMRQASWRWWVTGAATLTTGSGGMLLAADVTPWSVKLAVLAAGLVGLARYGRPLDKPILVRTVVRPIYRKLTAELTRKGIMATGLVKRPEDIVFPAGVGEIRRDGPGYLAIVDLPDGVIAVDVVEERPKLAGGLRLPMDQVWPEVMPREHPSRLALWVADRPVSAMKQPPWPLLRGGQTDYFKPFVYGFDPRMRPVEYRMDERNSLFAGFPGSGKSLSARVVLAGMALDPLAQFAVFDLAGRGDFDAFEPLCPPDLFGSGADEGTKANAYRMLMWLLKECDVRGPRIKHYATQGMNSENKLNRAIAAKDARLRPIVAAVDEVQELITDPEIGKSATAAMTSIVKRGRALGIHLVLMTQRIDNQSLPKGVTSNIALRTCLAVPSHVETDLALGTGAYRQGARPTQFEIGVDAGWGVRVGYGQMSAVRAAYLDRAAVEKVCARGVALRGGTTGPADLPAARDVLDDLRAVWVPAERGQHWDTLAGRLADRFPEAYSAVTPEALSALVRGKGVESRNVKSGGSTRKGTYLADITAAAQQREGDAG